jgi:MGT family glycosyltransferase
MQEWMLDTIPGQVEDIENIAGVWKPDVLLSDSALLAGVVVLKDRLPFPTAYFSALMGCIIPGPDAPPWGRGLPAPKNLRSKLVARTAQWITSWVTAGFRRRANEIRADFGLPPIKKRVVDEFAKVELLMINSSPLLDYNRRDLPACVRYVGACSWDTDRNSPEPEWIKALNGSRPVIHVTEGTIHTRQPMVLRAAAQGLSNLTMHVIMSTGKHRKPEDLDLGPTIGPNIRVEQFVSHLQLFPRTHVVVTTGGAGTVTKALLHGVPLVVVPGSWDLPENAQRVVECGAGIRIDPEQLTPQHLREAVERILADDRFRRNAARVGEELRALGGPEKVVSLLEDLLERRRCGRLCYNSA